MAEQYFGKYSGLVKSNRDDDKLGRLQVAVPAIFAPDEIVLARPVLPFGVFFVPEENTKVWVEFEGGDPNLPLWTGAQYGPGDWAQEAATSPPTVRAVKTAAGHLLVFDDTDGSEAIVITDGAQQHVIRLETEGITIEHGQSGHTITVGSSDISITYGGGQSSVTVGATTVTARTSTSTIELGPAGVAISGTPLIKLNNGSMPVVRAGIDIGIGNLGAPVVITPGQFTVLA